MRGLTLGEVSETNAQKYPDSLCVVEETNSGTDGITFATFDSRVNQLARVLQRRQIESGDRVAVYMEKNVETVETCYAAFKIGAVPVPINHRFKAREVEYVLSNAEAEICVFDDIAAETLDSIHDSSGTPDEYLQVGAGDSEYADEYHAERAKESADSVEIVPSRLDDAAIIYTSGTTGKPKGCVHTHETLLQSIVTSAYTMDLDENHERWLLTTPLFHIGGLQNFNTQFFLGSATYFLNDFDPVRTLDIIEAEGITGGVFVPVMSRQLLDVDDVSDYDVSTFEHYMTGGAASGEDLKRAVIETLNVTLREAFAQTETLGTMHLPPEDALDRPESIGVPNITVRLKIVDSDGDEVERGEIGRAAYKSPTIFRRYLKSPEKTAAVFDDEGYFVSGDLLRRDSEGYVYFVGRYDDMIVSGGENIYPAEIEEVLHEHEAIEEAAIVGVPDDTWGERVKAVVVAEPESNISKQDVTDHVAAELAGYKKPREVEFRGSLPRNPAGKILRDELS